MITFKQFIAEIDQKHIPEWEKPCWVVAINKTTGIPEDDIKKMAKRVGWDGKSFGAPIHTVIQVIWDKTGKMPDLSLTKTARGMTARKFSGTQDKTGVVFTRQHVMPMINGKLSNFNGHGEEEVIAVATF